jgi:hypothetical protein
VYAYFGHHKCGTRWILKVLDDVAESAGLTTHEVFRLSTTADELVAAVAEHRPDVLQFTNARPEPVAALGALRGFHVVRDPRDVVVSAYFSALGSHPTGEWWSDLDRIRARLQRASKRDGLLYAMDLRYGQFVAMRDWQPRPDVLEVRMEDLTTRPDRWVEVLSFLGLLGDGERQVAGSALREIVARHGFEQLSGGRRPGEADESSHYRKGVAGDWVEHFEPVHVAAFASRWNDLVLGLGYESDPDWWRAAYRRAG